MKYLAIAALVGALAGCASDPRQQRQIDSTINDGLLVGSLLWILTGSR
jgi:uncharacterized lipoprotein